MNEKRTSLYNAHNITKIFEAEIAEYCGSPFCVAVDNESNALALCLEYLGIKNQYITIPSHTYPSVPTEIVRSGNKVIFNPSDEILTGAYYLHPTKIVDSALRFTASMYIPRTYMCLSFTGPHKHLKLGKGGAILTDDKAAVKWLKKARFSGRDECSYHEDNFDINPVLGKNYYMPVETAARGLHLMPQFYNLDGSKKENEDLSMKYPDLSTFKLWK